MTPSPLNPDGPAVVALGGGHGLATSLRAARAYAGSITAVVSVADDGGSSGRLRAALGQPAPGDIRRCLGALADDESLLARAMEHRFGTGELRGHPVGNLLIAGLAEASGSFVAALCEVGRLLDACGEVLPATEQAVVIVAERADGSTVRGQVEVDHATGISRIGFDPAAPSSPEEVLRAIAAADQIILGPGSLHTSVLAALVPAVTAAVAQAASKKIFVANLRAVRSTDGWDLAHHVAALVDHGITPDIVLVDENSYLAEGTLPSGLNLVRRPLARFDTPAHDPVQLAKALADLVG